MDYLHAKQRMLFHAGFSPDFTHDGSFLGRLRPFQGLSETTFADICESMIVWYPLFKETDSVDKDVLKSIWWICDRTRMLVLRPDSSVRKNELISIVDLRKLTAWIDVIESGALGMLQGLDLPMCTFRLMEYLTQFPIEQPRLYAFLKPYLEMSLCYDDDDVRSTAEQVAGILAT